MKILIDMDGVLADFERGFLEAYQNSYPQEFFVPLDQRTTFYVRDQYPENLRSLVENIYFKPGFYLNLPLIKGAREALIELELKGQKIVICTSPLSANPFCISEKKLWIEKNLGSKWLNNLIFTKDKTIIDADFLIDDRPEIKGCQKPSWRQILYSQPYNSNSQSNLIMTWDNWREILEPLILF